jgi:putative (di)nucleoside polyphosphate hydrolase
MRNIPYDERPYRPCVGIFLINDKKQVFGGRRIDSRAEAWQMPQGGIDPGETAIDACMREMGEEIAITKETLYFNSSQGYILYANNKCIIVAKTI